MRRIVPSDDPQPIEIDAKRPQHDLVVRVANAQRHDKLWIEQPDIEDVSDALPESVEEATLDLASVFHGVLEGAHRPQPKLRGEQRCCSRPLL